MQGVRFDSKPSQDGEKEKKKKKKREKIFFVRSGSDQELGWGRWG